jgi:peroxiredoxin
MPFLTAIVALVGAVCLLDLVLTLGVMRRLREHADLLARSSAADGPARDPMLAAGEVAAPFHAVDTTGEPVTRDALTGRTLVGFFTPDCDACTERMPGFLAEAAAFPGGRAQVLAVVAAGAEDASAYRDRLAGVARVVVEPHRTGVAKALGVRGFPTFCVLDGTGRVIETGLPSDRSPVPA